jgi:hypothetical protein
MHIATGAAEKAIKVAQIPPCHRGHPDGKTAYITSDGPATVTSIRTVAIAGHR